MTLWRLTAAALLSCLCTAATACGAEVREPRAPRKGEAHFSVATFNLYFPSSSDRATVEAVGEIGADVVCLQEVSWAWERVLRERYGDRYPHVVMRSTSGVAGLAVLSRFPMEDEGLLAGTRGFKPAMVVRVRTPAGWVRILNLHLRARQQGTGNFIEKYASFPADHEAEIRHLVSLFPGEPDLVVGDFNEEQGGRALTWLAGRGFRNALPLFSPGAPTWRGRSVGGQLELTIDHILFDPTLEPLAARTSSPGTSDHLPVVAVFARSVGRGR